MKIQYTKNSIDKFWSRVDKESSIILYHGSRCWEWKSGFSQNGYGNVKLLNKTRYTHRVSYELAFGDIPNGLYVLHHCDNRKCVNPSHLFLGTARDNSDDKVYKNRQPRGETNGRCKLSDEQVAEIRRRYKPFGKGGEGSPTLAKIFGVSWSQIQKIVKYKQRT